MSKGWNPTGLGRAVAFVSDRGDPALTRRPSVAGRRIGATKPGADRPYNRELDGIARNQVNSWLTRGAPAPLWEGDSPCKGSDEFHALEVRLTEVIEGGRTGNWRQARFRELETEVEERFCSQCPFRQQCGDWAKKSPAFEGLADGRIFLENRLGVPRNPETAEEETVDAKRAKERARKAAFYAANRDKERERNRRYYEANKEKRRIARAKWRAKMKARKLQEQANAIETEV